MQFTPETFQEISGGEGFATPPEYSQKYGGTPEVCGKSVLSPGMPIISRAPTGGARADLRRHSGGVAKPLPAAIILECLCFSASPRLRASEPLR